MPSRFAYVLLILLSLLPRPAAAQWREAWSFEPGASLPSAAPTALLRAPPPPRLVGEASGSIGKGLLHGALIGAAAGASLFLAMEMFSDHTDHSQDGFVAVAVIVPSTAIGAAVGAIVSATGLHRAPE